MFWTYVACYVTPLQRPIFLCKCVCVGFPASGILVRIDSRMIGLLETVRLARRIMRHFVLCSSFLSAGYFNQEQHRPLFPLKSLYLSLMFFFFSPRRSFMQKRRERSALIFHPIFLPFLFIEPFLRSSVFTNSHPMMWCTRIEWRNQQLIAHCSFTKLTADRHH